MKTYDLDEIKEFAKKNKNYIEDDFEGENSYTIEEFDKAKTRVLKYVFYKKRTESEVRRKFIKDYSDDLINDLIEELKENNYIDDEKYIERAVDEFIALRNLSIREIKYKLISKGIKASDVENYIDNNDEKLTEYEKKSAENIVSKKKNQMEDLDIKRYLTKKGYKEEIIKEALQEK